MSDVMAHLAQRVSENEESVEDIFHRLDADNSGQLEPAELMRLFREVMPGMVPSIPI